MSYFIETAPGLLTINDPSSNINDIKLTFDQWERVRFAYQTSNRAATSVAAMGIGTVVLPAQAGAGIFSVTVGNGTSAYSSDSTLMFFLSVLNVSDATANRDVHVIGYHLPSGGNATVDLYTAQAFAAGAYELQWWMVN